ncbi:MAG TPA: PKD domain-containing protein, partial [Candidatus Lokiarchaeia archaeon]|nr:PKD domain-containing protein [Candidatus Lokiarchaeia archaeon]
THQYVTTPGSYLATLTIKDQENNIAVHSYLIIVLAYPVAAFTNNATAFSLVSDQWLQLNDTTTGGDKPFTYDWNFGDGTAHDTSQNATHLFVSGSYPFSPTVTLTVTDSEGGVATTSYAFEVVQDTPGPYVSFTASRATVIVGSWVQFNDTTLGGNTPYAWDWTFGDGTPHGTSQNATHQFMATGTYSITLAITDFGGDRVVSSPEIITVLPYLAASFTTNRTTVVAGNWIQFNDTTTGGDAPFNYQWNFGDGTGNFTTQTVAHQFTAAGTYTVTLTVTDALGGVSVAVVTITVTAAPETPDNSLLITVAIVAPAAAVLVMVGIIIARKRAKQLRR